MPIYSKKYVVPAATTQSYDLEAEGDIITYVRLRFPPGPQGLLNVRIKYGIKQIFPFEENTYFAGDNEIIDWQEYFVLPETPCTLTVEAINNDDTYEHSFYLVLVTQKREHLLSQLIAQAVRAEISKFIMRLTGALTE